MRNYVAYAPSQLVELVTDVFLPDPDLIVACCRRRRQVAPLLLDWLEHELTGAGPEYEDFPELGENAVLLLSEWREPGALTIYERVMRTAHLADRIAEEIFYRAITTYGRSAVPMLSGVVLDPDAPADWGRSCAAEMLGSIAAYDPSTRDEVVRVLRAVLPPLGSDGCVERPVPASEEHSRVWTSAISELGRLKDFDSISHVTAMFESGYVDTEWMGLHGYEARLFSDYFDRSTFRPGLSWLRPRLGFMLAHVMVRRERILEAIDQSGTAPAEADATRYEGPPRTDEDRLLQGYVEWVRNVEAAAPEDTIHASRAPILGGDLLVN